MPEKPPPIDPPVKLPLPEPDQEVDAADADWSAAYVVTKCTDEKPDPPYQSNEVPASRTRVSSTSAHCFSTPQRTA